MSAKPEKTDKIDNIVGMLMEYERMTIDLMKKASDTPILDQYDLRPPYSKARLIKEEGQVKYQIIEVPLSDDEKAKLREVGELLVEELDVDVKKLGGNQNAAAYIRKMVDKIIKNYKIKVTPDGLDRIMYYVTRDFVFFDKIDPMMRDPWIEDISCNGFGIPLYIWHRKYESIPTNVIFNTAEELDRFIQTQLHDRSRDLDRSTSPRCHITRWQPCPD